MKNINMKRDPLERALPKRNTIIKGTSIINKDYHRRIRGYLKSVPVICRDAYP